MRNHEPMTIQLFRENRHVEPSIGRDVWFIVQLGILAFLGYVIAVLVMA